MRAPSASTGLESKMRRGLDRHHRHRSHARHARSAPQPEVYQVFEPYHDDEASNLLVSPGEDGSLVLTTPDGTSNLPPNPDPESTLRQEIQSIISIPTPLAILPPSIVTNLASHALPLTTLISFGPPVTPSAGMEYPAQTSAAPPPKVTSEIMHSIITPSTSDESELLTSSTLPASTFISILITPTVTVSPPITITIASSSVTPLMSSVGTFMTTSVTTSTVSTPSSTANSLTSSTARGHTALFWIGVVFAVLVGLIIILLCLLFLSKHWGAARRRAKWEKEYFDDPFNPANNKKVDAVGKISDEELGRDISSCDPSLVASSSLQSTQPPTIPMPNELKFPSSLVNNGPYPQPVPLPAALLAAEFDQMSTFPHSLHIVNELPGDLSPEDQNTQLGGGLTSLSLNNTPDLHGTPRIAQAPFLSLPDGGLRLPWEGPGGTYAHSSYSDPALPLRRSPSSPICNRRVSIASRTTRYTDPELDSATLPAEGWASTLRNNLFTALNAFNTTSGGSDNGLTAPRISPILRNHDNFTRQYDRGQQNSRRHRKRRSRNAGTQSSSGSSPSGASRDQSQLTNPFSTPERRPAPRPAHERCLEIPKHASERLSASSCRSECELRFPDAVVHPATPRRMSRLRSSLLQLPPQDKDFDPTVFASQIDIERIERWRHDAPRRPLEFESVGKRPFLRRRGSSVHDGGYTSAEY